MDKIQSIKQRFEIIGNDLHLNRAIGKAIRVSPTDISVLVTGESGVGKESIPRIIHQLSLRKHGKFIALIVAPSPKEQSIRSCLVMKRGPLQVLLPREAVILKKLMVELYFWMK